MNTFWSILLIVWVVSAAFNLIVLSIVTLVDSSGHKCQRPYLLLTLIVLASLLGPVLWIFGEVYHWLYKRGVI
jgi:hypothetical protein